MATSTEWQGWAVKCNASIGQYITPSDHHINTSSRCGMPMWECVCVYFITCGHINWKRDIVVAKQLRHLMFVPLAYQQQITDDSCRHVCRTDTVTLMRVTIATSSSHKFQQVADPLKMARCGCCRAAGVTWGGKCVAYWHIDKIIWRCATIVVVTKHDTKRNVVNVVTQCFMALDRGMGNNVDG